MKYHQTTLETEIAGNMAVVKGWLKQLITGEWSDIYTARTYLLRNKNRDAAYEQLNGFIWGLAAAGIIATAARESWLDALLK